MLLFNIFSNRLNNLFNSFYKENLIYWHQTKNAPSFNLPNNWKNRVADHFEINEGISGKNRVAGHSKIEEKAIKRNRVISQFKIEEEIESANRKMSNVSFFY